MVAPRLAEAGAVAAATAGALGGSEPGQTQKTGGLVGARRLRPPSDKRSLQGHLLLLLLLNRVFLDLL